ncbi:hydrolase [Rhodomicrobium udaipurense JA643]|uniref:Linear amide C-N hydrolase n=1 Tax=Rhodomicrobium udaipurense TaxID=1202716 RepID=A0A8I1KGD5_9HYPH|nr:linear amide C-N hydrolase [Rhodomicrobium udaipurense]KAI94148.1 hydrolase [Rhodomicrobium udaipurense JA643]MBJ7542635.1 linear amide C-N hydrolase [Rhodomicrobium udaipurense]
MKPRALALLAAAFALTSAGTATPCTRILFTGEDKTVLTGRTLDWMEDMASDLWAFPAGLERDGAAGPRSLKWTSKYGSVVTASYNAGSGDGLNEKGLVANLLYLAEADYGSTDSQKPLLSNVAWAQYALDNFATVAEAVEALRKEPFALLAPTFPNGSASTLHLSLSDASGDSAIFEYVGGKLLIHHGKQYTVMTNSPTYDKQLAINGYWEDVGGYAFLPGTSRASDRFARASFFLNRLPKKIDPNYIKSVPDQSFDNQAAASVLSTVRSVSVPLGLAASKDEPNIASTIWRTVADQKDRAYYFDSATRPNTFWVSLDKLDLKRGAPVKKLALANGEIYAGETADKFKDAAPFKFLEATATARADAGEKRSDTAKRRDDRSDERRPVERVR